MRLSGFAAAVFAMGAAFAAQAQTIYPLNRAEILSGSKFDFKVEFPGAPAEADIKVTVNGKSPAQVLGAAAKFMRNEDGLNQSAFWIRDASIAAPGHYTIKATSGGKSAQVRWEVFGTPKGRVARNVILFVGDGMSVAHRTAARIMSKGLVEGRYGGELAIDDMPHMALVSTSGTDSVVTDLSLIHI
jgi:alkaline phosphatase